MKNSEKYWRKREEARKRHIKDEEEYRKKIEAIYRSMMSEISDQILAFYQKYASEEGLNMAEVKKKCRKLDIEEFSKKAKKYVKEKDFSEEANAEMKIYNLTMKVNRLELLKAQLGLELVAGTDEIEKFLKKELEGRTIEELERQAGILGHSLVDNQRLVHSIVNASFYHATFSDRIWANQSNLKYELDKILQTALIQGRNPREFIPRIRKAFDVSVNQAYRLLVTELARVQTDAQMKSFKKNGFDQFTFHALGTACDLCLELNGKHFNVEDGESGKNMPPIHPHCRCSTSAYMDDEDYEEWLDGHKEHGLTWEEWKELSDQERERVRIPDTGKEVPGHVNSKLANSKQMHDKFENLTNHKLVNESLYNNSLQLLLDNNDTEFEHLIAIDSRKGTLLVKNTESANAGLTHQCGFSKKQNQDLKEWGILFETLHNHPNSSIPSRDDIKKLFERKYQSASNVICHDTTVHRLEKIKEFDDIESFIDKVYHKSKEKYYAYGDNKIENYCSEELIKMLIRGGYLKYVKR